MPASIFNGLKIKLLKPTLNFFDRGDILFDPDDPTSVAKDALQGSLYARTGASGGTVFQKQDNGSTTNWTAVGTIFEEEGTPLTVRGTANFVGQGVTVTDTGSKTQVEILGVLPVTETTATSLSITDVNTIYLANNGSGEVAYTLPATFARGSIVGFVGAATGNGWNVTAASGDKIVDFDGTEATSSDINSGTNINSTIFLMGEVANDTWKVVYDRGQDALTAGFSTGYAAMGTPDGTSASVVDDMQKIIFATDTVSNLANVLGTEREQSSGSSADSDHGYLGHGQNSAGAEISSIEEVDFPSETGTTLGITSSAVGTNNAASSDLNGKCYLYNDDSPGTEQVDEILSATSTINLNVATSSGQYSLGWYTQNGTNGYHEGESPDDDVAKIVHATTTTSLLSAVLSRNQRSCSAVEDGVDAFALGLSDTGGVNQTDDIEIFNFGTETGAADTEALDSATYNRCGATGATKGVIMGGRVDFSTGPVNDRIDEYVYATNLSETLTETLTADTDDASGLEV